MAARWQRAGRRGNTPRLIVIHCTVSPEQGNGAEAVARYFETTTRPSSTHKVCDNNSTVRCVEDEDTAYGAAGANLDGLHLELVGMPDQTRSQWLDDYSTAELFQAGLSVREWAAKFTIPLRWLTVAQVADGETAGLCTHHDVSQAFPDVSTGHWDPGPNFPKDEALRIWAPSPTAPPAQEDDMPKATYIRRRDQAAVYLAGLAVPPRHVTSFKAVEYHATREGVELLAPPADGSESITDGDGTTRKVMVVDDGTLFGI